LIFSYKGWLEEVVDSVQSLKRQTMNQIDQVGRSRQVKACFLALRLTFRWAGVIVNEIFALCQYLIVEVRARIDAIGPTGQISGTVKLHLLNQIIEVMSRCCHGEEECMVYHAEASLGAMMEPAA
jgi:hypothetical protein